LRVLKAFLSHNYEQIISYNHKKMDFNQIASNFNIFQLMSSCD